MRTLLALAFLAILLAVRVSGADTASSAVRPPSSGPAAELSATDAIILGVIEGVTEFLPISSTGHLIIGNRLLRLNSNEPLVGADGQPLWFKKPSAENPAGEPLTLRLAANTYTFVIQFGAIAAVALLYWSRIMSIIAGIFGRDADGRRLLGHLFIASLPVGVLGLMFNDWIDANLFSVGTVIAAQVGGALLMFYAESWRRRRARAESMGTSPPLHGDTEKHALREISPRRAAIVGVWQCLSLWPGMSRSMSTIVGGYFAGMDAKRAAEFSFLLGLITIGGAALLKSLKSGAAMIQVFGWPHVVLGGLVAAVTAAVCVRFLVHWLTRHGLTLFAWYRIVVAVILALYFRSELLS